MLVGAGNVRWLLVATGLALLAAGALCFALATPGTYWLVRCDRRAHWHRPDMRSRAIAAQVHSFWHCTVMLSAWAFLSGRKEDPYRLPLGPGGDSADMRGSYVPPTAQTALLTTFEQEGAGLLRRNEH